jgi:hypothetical protein
MFVTNNTNAFLLKQLFLSYFFSLIRLSFKNKTKSCAEMLCSLKRFIYVKETITRGTKRILMNMRINEILIVLQKVKQVIVA